MLSSVRVFPTHRLFGHFLSVCRCILSVPFDVFLQLIPDRWKFFFFSVSWHLFTNPLFVMTICCITFMSHGRHCLSFPTDFQEERLWIRFLLHSFVMGSLNDNRQRFALSLFERLQDLALFRFFHNIHVLQRQRIVGIRSCSESHKKLKGSKLLQKVQPAW